MQKAKEGAASGSVCFAEHQSAGTGRRGRNWVSPLGCNLYFSLLWRFPDGPARLGGLSLIMAMATIDALESLGIFGLAAKWPNDIVSTNGKVGGILMEVAGEHNGPCHVVVGIGLNIGMPQSPGGAIEQAWSNVTSQDDEPSRNEVAIALLDYLFDAMQRFEIAGAASFMPAMVALLVRGRVQEHEGPLVAHTRSRYLPLLWRALVHRYAVVGAAIVLFASSLGLFTRLGQEFAPRLAELDLLVHAIRIPSTGIGQSTAMQLDVERALRGVPEVAFVFSKTGTPEMASDPMPPNVSDTFVILKPRSDWPVPGHTKEDVRLRVAAALQDALGTSYEYTQPIEMRFNEVLPCDRGSDRESELIFWVSVLLTGENTGSLGR